MINTMDIQRTGLSAWLGHELCAALAIGYADEQPEQRPRKSISECTDWRG